MSDIALLLFEGITALDAVGPYEVLQRLPGFAIKMVAVEPGPKRTDEGNLALVADYALADVTEPTIVLVPGGFGSDEVMQDETTLAWLRRAHETTRFTTSVIVGGAAELLAVGTAVIIEPE